MWLDSARKVQNLVWRLPWPPDIVDNLVSSTNPQGKITSFDLELAALLLQEATLLEAVPKAYMAAPRSGSDNTRTFSWSMHEASMINSVVADLLCIRVLHSRKFSSILKFLSSRCMADNASHLFIYTSTD